ncbi:MAG TPA: protein translocase subunit SecF [Actinomycetales bacterium]|nr:protein translocase subunit SecF [Actinomycetales bacterium]
MSRFAAFGNRLYTGETSVEIVRRQKIWYTASAVVLLISVLALGFRGLTLGLEFTGGSEFRVTGTHTTADLPGSRAVTSVVPEATPKVARVGSDSVRVQTDRLSDTQTEQVKEKLAVAYGVKADNVTASFVGPSWGKSVSKKALTGLIVFLVLVGIVIAGYFRNWKSAVSAVAALLHDLVITVGIYALVGFEVTPASVIGFLTILGYSLYDTVVVFDKIRENTHGITAQTKRTYSEAANLAVNQTLVRSINTSVVALLPVGSILFIGAFLLGAGTLKDLSLALFVGIATGTYSSVFIAPPLLADLREREPEMIALRKRVLSRRENPSAGPAPRPARGARGRAATAVLDRPTAAATIEDDPASAESPASSGEPEATGRARANGSAGRPARSPRPGAAGQRSQPSRKKGSRPKGKKR